VKTLRRFATYYRGHLKLFALDIACLLLVAAADLFYPMVARSIINDYIPNHSLRLILIWGSVLAGIYLVKFIGNFIVQYYGHCVGVGMQADMRRDVFARLERLPFSFFDNNKVGSLMSRIVNDLQEVSELAHHGPEDFFISAILLVGSFVVMARLCLPMTIVIFLFLPILVLFSVKMRRRMSAAFLRTRVEVAEINAGIENSVSGVRVTKAFTNSAYEEERFAGRNRAYVAARKAAYKVMAQFHSTNTLLLDLLYVVVLLTGGIYCYRGDINYGDFVAFLLYVNMFLNPIRKIINFVEQYQNGMTGFRRFLEIMDTAPETDRPEARDLARVSGKISYEHVSFRYETGDAVLNDISVTVAPGKTLALVGPSGGGKTTFCHLLPRFYDLESGSIRIDDTDIRDITLRSLREHIGIVQQEVFLFTGTIYENIAYGRPDATREEVEAAARSAQLTEFIDSLPDGYETNIGEHGIKLSGGQKQRLSIARVFLKNPPILILDEATSALDNVTETMIQKSLEQLSKGRTTLVVAHRLSTVRRADEIIVLTDQGVEERGSHEQLLAQNGIYATLYNSQFKNDL